MKDPAAAHGITRDTHEARRTSFDNGAPEYDRVRPEWPADTLDWLLGSPADPLDVLDLGAGTGKGTRALADLGHRVTAVEPSDGMRAALESGLGSREVEVLPGRAEQLPLTDASVDSVVCLQAWHWVDPEAAGPEAARVLRPGGTFGLAWHVLDTTEGWLRELHAVTRRPERSAPSAADEDPLAIPGFVLAQPHLRSYDMRLSPADLATQIGSWSHVAIHPERDTMLEEVRRLGERFADADGLVGLPHTTRCYRAKVIT